MIASWMLYALLVGVLTGAAALMLEEVFRLRGRAVRFLWLGALLGTVALVATAPLRIAAPVVIPDGVVAEAPMPPRARQVREDGFAALAARALDAARDAVAAPIRAAARLGPGAGTALGAGWLALSALLLAAGAATLLRARRTRRGWPLEEMAGARVRVAPGVGPAVLGVTRPEVVVPAWLLEAPPEEQAMVVAHEREHIRARDPLVLAAGSLAAALMPWNPAAWWMLLRLRAAVELDCDARVLRRGVRPREYGTLLIDMAGRGPGLSLGAPALAGWPSTLERRLRAMNVRRMPRFARLRASALAVLGLAALAGACESPLPTSAEVEKMDVAAVEEGAAKIALTADEMTYVVDGEEVTREQAHALLSNRIGTIEVTRAADGRGTIRISTTGTAMDGERMRVPRGGGRAHVEGSGTEFKIRSLEARMPGGSRARIASSSTFDGLLVIDGVISPRDALNTIDPNGIESVEVLKGTAATQQYSDPRAANGVIRVTTKKAQ
ncbi:MAG TPA: M56 family metallopeptidase [Longimicrobium sp.]|nr:M56 family metallopeptidase [Longimicrobium sp.]